MWARNIRKVLFLLITIIVFIFIMIVSNHYYKNRYLIVSQLTDNEVYKLKQNRKEYDKIIDLYYEKHIIPYSKNDDFYLLHIDNDKDIEKIYTLSNFKVYLINIEDNYLIHLFLYNDKYYKELTLQLTNLPVINVLNDDVDLFGFDSKIQNIKGNLALRGDSSQFSQKKSYKLSLKNDNNKNIELPLLGMKKNSYWSLNPLYFDASYMREKISYDIWNSLSYNFNHTLEYIELFIDGQYLGLYCLQEYVDMNTFHGNINQDFLISINAWNGTSKNEYMDIFKIEDGLKNDSDKQNDIMDNFYKLIKNKKYNGINFKFDMDNLSNYYVFINLTSLLDNVFKNEKVFFRKFDDYYLIQKTVWDLDWAFNNENIKATYNVEINIDEIIYDKAMPENIKDNEDFLKAAKEKYFNIRQTVYNETYLYLLIDNYTAYLKKYHAMERDMIKWQNDAFDRNIKIIKDFIKKRISVLDKYFGGI